MKLNLEIDLDWIDEEKGLDQTIKEEIISSVVSKIQAGIEKKLEDKINQLIDSTIIDRINKKTDELFAEFVSRQITLTDNYGSKIEVYESLEALMKKRFDNFMTERVDEKGNSSSSNYGKHFSRIDFIIKHQLETFAKEFTTNAVKRVSEEIKEHVKDGLTQKLGAELMTVLKVNDMLKIGN